MKKIVNECVGCKDLGLPCLGASCPNRKVVRFYCDCCKEEMAGLYQYGDKQFCIYCLEDRGIDPNNLNEAK